MARHPRVGNRGRSTHHAGRRWGIIALLMASPSLGGGLTWPDYAVLFCALGGLLLIGGAFTREQRNTAEFFLARRRIPWWAAWLSFLASEISADRKCTRLN